MAIGYYEHHGVEFRKYETKDIIKRDIIFKRNGDPSDQEDPSDLYYMFSDNKIYIIKKDHILMNGIPVFIKHLTLSKEFHVILELEQKLLIFDTDHLLSISLDDVISRNEIMLSVDFINDALEVMVECIGSDVSTSYKKIFNVDIKELTINRRV